MKKIAIIIASLLLGASALSAQDLAGVTELYNNGAAALGNGEKTAALTAFQKALTGATALGDAGKEVADNCKNIIPEIVSSIAKDLFKEGNIDEAVTKAKEALELAKSFNLEDSAADIKTLVGQFLAQKGAKALNAKDYAAAIEAYKEVLAENPTDGKSAIRLGMAFAANGNTEDAIAAYNLAAQNGQEAAAKKQIAGINLKAASAALKAKDYKTALEKALESAESNPTANAYKIAGNAAAQLKNYKGAVEYFGKYLEVNPAAADAAQVKANIEAFKKLVK